MISRDTSVLMNVWYSLLNCLITYEHLLSWKPMRLQRLVILHISAAVIMRTYTIDVSMDTIFPHHLQRIICKYYMKNKLLVLYMR